MIGLVGTRGSELEAPAGPPPAAVPAADPLSYPGYGLRMARPRGWTAEKVDGLVRLRAGDGTTSIVVAPAPRETDADALARSARDAVGRTVSAPAVRGHSVLALGGVRAPATELRGRSAQGVPLDIVIAVAAGRWRTYAVTVLRASAAPPGRLEEIRTALASIRFHRPRE